MLNEKECMKERKKTAGAIERVNRTSKDEIRKVTRPLRVTVEMMKILVDEGSDWVLWVDTEVRQRRGRHSTGREK